MGMIASVVGATGLVGQELVTQLCHDAQVDTVHVLTRRALSGALAASNPKLIQHVVDFDHLDSAPWPRSDVFFCCLGTTIKAAGSQTAFHQVDCEYVVNAAQLAHQAGATRLSVVSAMGANPHSSIFYNRVKAEMEAAVALIGFESVVIFRPSFLAGNRSQSRPGERIALTALKVGNLFLPKKYRSVAAHAVARGMIIAAKEKQHGVRIIESDKIQDYA